jgi:hypothetical protein
MKISCNKQMLNDTGLLVFPTKLNTECDKQLPGILDEVRVA